MFLMARAGRSVKYMDIIKMRRSVRRFTGAPISKNDIEKICDAGSQAPSAMNQQLERYFVTLDPEKIKGVKELLDGNAEFLEEAGAFVLVLYEKKETRTFDMVVCDLGAVVENMLLRATELKIGSCWIGLLNREARIERVRNYFKIPEKYLLYAAIGFGVPKDDKAFFDKKKSYLDKMFWEKF